MKNEIKNLIADTLRSEEFIDQSGLLDNEDSESRVRSFLDCVEGYINKKRVTSQDSYVTFQMYPNIPIVRKFLDKWKVDALLFNRWVVIDNSDAEGLVWDLDGYNDDFSAFRLNDKSFKYYQETYKESEILSDNYQYKEIFSETNKIVENETREYLKTIPLGILLEEIKGRVTRDAGEQVLKMISDDCQEICSKISALKVVEPL